MDLWGVGCVFFELLSLFPLFPGDNELDQIHKIHNILGTPSMDILNQFKKYLTIKEETLLTSTSIFLLNRALAFQSS